MFNIFENFRKLGLDANNQSLIRFESPVYQSQYNFCDQPHVTGSPPSALIGDSNNTAYANNYYSGPENQSIIIGFVLFPVYIQDFYFYSICLPPKTLKIQGSNDKSKWITIGYHNNPIKSYSLTIIPCTQRKLFKFIKISQDMNINDKYRLHIRHIEIFGTIGKLEQISQTFQFHYSSSLAFVCLLLK